MSTRLIILPDGAIDELMSMVLAWSMDDVCTDFVGVLGADCVGPPTVEVSQKILRWLGTAEVPVALSQARGVNAFPWAYRPYSMMANLVPLLNPTGEVGKPVDTPSAEAGIVQTIQAATYPNGVFEMILRRVVSPDGCGNAALGMMGTGIFEGLFGQDGDQTILGSGQGSPAARHASTDNQGIGEDMAHAPRIEIGQVSSSIAEGIHGLVHGSASGQRPQTERQAWVRSSIANCQRPIFRTMAEAKITPTSRR